MHHYKKFTDKISQAARAGVRYLATLWRRLTSEPGYADAAASVVVAGVALLCRNPRLVRFAADTARALVTLVRTLTGEPHGSTYRDAVYSLGDARGWSSDPDWDVEPGWS